jgi:precorrin-2 dehydrogenase/sirohydrochlorin ferrochelatase
MEGLLAAGAIVTVIAPKLDPHLQPFVDGRRIRYVGRNFQRGDTFDAFFVIAATSNAEVNRVVAAEAAASSALVNVASEPALGNCSFMSPIRRGALTVGITTSGASPLVAAAVRSKIEAALPPNLETVLDELGAMRAELRVRVPDPIERGKHWQEVANQGEIERAFAPDARGALERIRELLGLRRD